MAMRDFYNKQASLRAMTEIPRTYEEDVIRKRNLNYDRVQEIKELLSGILPEPEQKMNTMINHNKWMDSWMTK